MAKRTQGGSQAIRRRLRWLAYHTRRAGQRVVYLLLAPLAFLLLKLLIALGPDRASNLGGRLARQIGPWLPVHRVGRDNLRHAFPEKSDAEIETILREVWDNLGRTAAEYPHLQALWDFDPENPGTGRIDVDGIDRFVRLRDDGKPAIVFTAHLANWELPAVCAAHHGLLATVVYRTPNNPYVARRVESMRAGAMGEMLPAGSGQAVALAMAAVIERGGHLGVLVDQRLKRGLKLPFFGRPAPTNPIVARLARRFDCPVHGVRVIRLADNRFRLELTEEIELPRDAGGEIDIEEAMATINGIVETWVREHPGQWLWLHRRWRL